MQVYDKAAWHIDGGENPSEVVKRFADVFEFLKENGMLNDDGIEVLEFAMDSSVSLNSSLVNTKGQNFLEVCYDEVLKLDPDDMKDTLADAYHGFEQTVSEVNTD